MNRRQLSGGLLGAIDDPNVGDRSQAEIRKDRWRFAPSARPCSISLRSAESRVPRVSSHSGDALPLIVRQNGTPDTYEIVAGKRRYQAALAVAQETGEAEALSCAVIEADDDAAAVKPR